MRTAASVLLLIALVALAVMSFAPAELVGIRAGLRSIAGAVTALALLLITLVGAWLWLRDKRKKHD
jgi:hypothetical protein